MVDCLLKELYESATSVVDSIEWSKGLNLAPQRPSYRQTLASTVLLTGAYAGDGLLKRTISIIEPL